MAAVTLNLELYYGRTDGLARCDWANTANRPRFTARNALTGEIVRGTTLDDQTVTFVLSPGRWGITWRGNESESLYFDVPSVGDDFDATRLACNGNSVCIGRLEGYGFKRWNA